MEKEWLKEVPNYDEIRTKIKIIVDDFIFAKDNSLGIGKTPINEAKPIIQNF